MRINFRQGIVSSQKIPPFLQLSSTGNVSFNASVQATILAFSEGSSDYLLTEATSITDAWTLPNGQECWLYWDISKENASRTFGYTLYNPFVYSQPTNPQMNQMYFDQPSFRWKSWNGQVWIDVIRVIAGYVDANKKIQINFSGTQVNWLQPSTPDVIVFDTAARPIKLYTDEGFEFYTATTIKNFKNDNRDTFTYERIRQANGIATDNITQHRCVTWKDYGTLQLADPTLLDSPAFAIAERSVATGEIVSVYFSGFVTNRYDWNWTQPPHTYLYVGSNGQLTATFDPSFSTQRVGYIVNPNTIYVEFEEQYVSYFQPSPTPSVTITPSQTATPTPTPTPSITPSVTQPVGQTYDQVVLSKSPIAYWPLNTDYTDVVSGNNLNPGSGSVELIPDAYGNTLYLAPPNQGASYNDQIALISNFSLEAWVEWQDHTASGSDNYFTIFGTDVYGLQIYQDGTLYMYGNTDSVSAVGLTLDINVTYHIVAVVDSAKNVTFYVNNVAYPGSAALVDNYNFLYIGNNTNQEFFYGMIGNPAIYNFALTAGQVAEDYVAGTNNYRYASTIVLPSPTPTLSPTLTPTPPPQVTPTPQHISRLSSTGVIDAPYSHSTDFGVITLKKTADDKIYVGGAFTNVDGVPYGGVARLNTDGSLDTTFTNITFLNGVSGIYQNTDGNIYMGGGILYYDGTNYHSLGIARFTPTGVFDTSYTQTIAVIAGNSGPISFSPSNVTGGMIVVGNFIQNGYTKVLKLDANGVVDTTLPVLSFNFSLNPTSTIMSGGCGTADGKVYVYGQFDSVNGDTTKKYVIRLNSDGTLDTTFVDLGLTTTVNYIIQTVDGKIYIAGGGTANIVRLNSDGTLDTGYTPPAGVQAPFVMYQTADGKIYCSSYFANTFRLNSDGTADPSFSISITTKAAFAQAADGRIYIGY